MLVDRLVHQHALHLDAHLTGIGEGAEREALGHPVEVAGVLVHHGRGVSAQLQTDLLLPGDVLEVPADRRAAGEGEHREARVGREPLRHRNREMQDVVGPRGQPALGHDPAQPEGELRALRRWLDHQRAADGDGRRDFVGQQIERES